MTKIRIDKHGQCVVKLCPFIKSCAQHCTATDWRSEEGFAPSIKRQGHTFFCETINSPINGENIFNVEPPNVGLLSQGFRSLEELQNL